MKRLKISWFALADLEGGARRMPPSRVQILLFWHTTFFKRNCLGSPRPPYEVHIPLYGKSWIRHWFVQVHKSEVITDFYPLPFVCVQRLLSEFNKTPFKLKNDVVSCFWFFGNVEPPPQKNQFFSNFDKHFFRKNGHAWGWGAHASGKCWIRHWILQICLQINLNFRKISYLY